MRERSSLWLNLIISNILWHEVCNRCYKTHLFSTSNPELKFLRRISFTKKISFSDNSFRQRIIASHSQQKRLRQKLPKAASIPTHFFCNTHVTCSVIKFSNSLRVPKKPWKATTPRNHNQACTLTAFMS